MNGFEAINLKMLRKDLKNDTVKILVESPDDLWHLSNIIGKGDLVRLRTFRKVIVKSGGDFKYGDKKPMVLTLRTDTADFQKDTGVFRLGGEIVEGPDSAKKSAHHYVNLEEGTRLSIIKKWKPYHLERIKKAGKRKPALLVCVIDRDEADLAAVMESGVEMKTSIVNQDAERMEEFYDRVIKCMEGEKGYERIILAGPGFERENLLKYMKQKKSLLVKDIILEKSSSTGINGVNEVIRSSSVRILKDTRISKESRLVEDVLGRIKSGGMAVYGPEETRKAVKSGAVEKLMVSDKKVYENEGLMEEAEKQAGEVVIIGSDHEKGEQFLHLGGIAAFTRYKLD